MRKMLILSVLLLVFCGMNVFAGPAGTCSKCERIREYNREHPSKYTYYEDYLNDKKSGKVADNKNPYNKNAVDNDDNDDDDSDDDDDDDNDDDIPPVKGQASGRYQPSSYKAPTRR